MPHARQLRRVHGRAIRRVVAQILPEGAIRIFYFLYNQTSGLILAANTTGFTPGTGEAVLGPLSSADTNAVVAYQYPQRFLVQGSPAALVEQPWWDVQVSPASTAGQYTVTATLQNPPSTPPSTATLTLAGGSLSGTVSSNQVSWTIAVHPSVASQQITATVSASGTVSGTATFGGTAQSIGLQLVTTANPPLVAPAGPGSKAYLRTYFLGLSADTQIAILTEALQDLLGADTILLHMLFDAKTGIVAALTSGTTPLLTLDSNTANLVSDIQANILPQLPFTLDQAYPSGGTRFPLYESMVTMAGTFGQGALGYVQALQTLPNLQ
ncbi:MAG: hypothetical protein K6V97_03765 [Actinomycetia bacterium]|nr:hypothetical protein [Actinomycetes bacterium]